MKIIVIRSPVKQRRQGSDRQRTGHEAGEQGVAGMASRFKLLLQNLNLFKHWSNLPPVRETWSQSIVR